MQNFKSLKVWSKSHQLTLAIYNTTAKFPKDELYGLTRQMRRASASIPANIAEGCGREGKAELARFLQVSMGSASELEYHFLLAHDLGLMGEQDYRLLSSSVTEVKRMLSSFIRKLRGERRGDLN
jgi:four helix bundle protein